MVRKIIPLQSISMTTQTSVPAGARLWAVRGESSTKPTYDFTVIQAVWDGSTANTVMIKYCGTKNGQQVSLFHDWPAQVTSTLAPSADGDLRVSLIPGTDVVLQTYYLAGSVATA